MVEKLNKMHREYYNITGNYLQTFYSVIRQNPGYWMRATIFALIFAMLFALIFASYTVGTALIFASRV